MPGSSIIALIVVVTIAWLMLVYAPPPREHAPGAKPVEEKPPASRPREPKRKSSTTFEGEPVLHKSYRHWIVLVVRGFVPLLLLTFFGGLAFYRWIGGQFIVADVTSTGQISVADVLLVLFIVITLVLWRRSALRRRKDKKYKPPFGVQSLPDITYLVVVAVLALILFFRFQGGRVFY